MAVKDVLVFFGSERCLGFSIRSPDVPCDVLAMGSERIPRRTPRAVDLHASHHRGARQNASRTKGVCLMM